MLQISQTIHVVLLASCTLLFAISCSSGGSKKKISSPVKTSPSETFEADDSSSGGDVSVAGNKKTLTYSMSNSSLTSQRIKRSKAREYGDELLNKTKKATKKDRLQLEALVTAQAVGGASFSEVLSASKRLMRVELSDKVKNKLPDMAKLQLAISALQAGRYTMAEHFMVALASSKNPKIRAAV